MDSLINRIQELKQSRDAVILAHYYVNEEIQAIADFVGDSYYLSKIATTVPQQTIIYCGVSFMGESAKILNPEKTVIMPELTADCPMAHMAEVDKILEMRKQHEDLAVVCYINSTAEIKAFADVCVTSANAVKIVKKLPNQNIYFIPDANLGRYVAGQVPEKKFFFSDGFCHVHTSIKKENVMKTMELFPSAEFLAHPECTADVLALADYIGSTSGIIEYATNSSSQTFLIGTEMGVLYELKQKNPDKKFFSVGHRQFCPNMKKITLEKVAYALEQGKYEMDVEDEVRMKSTHALSKMLELAQ